MASFAGDPQLYDVKRLHMFDAYDTNKWKWMSAAVRPGTEVRNLLDVLQTSLVASMLKPAYDPLQPQLDNWVCRRRAARMAMQACGHVRWAIGQASCFLKVLGARCPLHRFRLATHYASPNLPRFRLARIASAGQTKAWVLARFDQVDSDSLGISRESGTWVAGSPRPRTGMSGNFSADSG